MDIVERRLEVDIDDGVPLGLLHAEHEPVTGDAGVVDKDVDMAEIRVDFLHGSLSVGEVCRVGRVCLYLDPKV